MVRLFNKVNGNSCVLLVWGIIEKGLHLGKVPKGVVPGASVSGLGGGTPPPQHTNIRELGMSVISLCGY